MTENEARGKRRGMIADIRAISKWLNVRTGGVPRGEIALLILEHAEQAAEIERLRSKEHIEEYCVAFYRWWHNQPGTNTDEGFNDWWESADRKALEDER